MVVVELEIIGLPAHARISTFKRLQYNLLEYKTGHYITHDHVLN